MKEIGESAAWLRCVSDSVAAYAVSTLRHAVAAIVRPASVVALVSLGFSAISLYVTVLEQPRLMIFAGCNWQYGRGPGSFDEYFVIPVTLVNTGARGGTVLAVELVVDKTASPRSFVGRFTEAGFDNTTRQLFAPLAIDGHGSASSTVVFTERTRTSPPLFDLPAFSKPERFRATLTFQSVAHVSYPVIDRLLASPPAEARFESSLQPADIAPIFADKPAGFDACAQGPSNLPGGT
jgi:hypothetical protein